MKIKVLHVVLSMETGGLENGIVNLVNHSNQDKFIVDILCLRERGELADRITNPNSQVIFDDNRDHGLISAIKKIRNAIKTGGYDIIHTHGFTTMLAGYIAHKLSGKGKIINGEHGTLYFDSFKQRAMQKFLFSKMDLNLSVSKDLKNKIFDAFSVTKDNFLPIINGVDTDKFKPEAGRNLRSQFGIEEDSLVIGSVGRLVPVKDYPSLITAFSELQFSKPTHLLLIGDGQERSTLETLVENLNLSNRVHFAGRRDDVASLIHALDVFVLPSLSEGLSNTLLESMSSGIPVLACNVGGNPEIVVPDVTGYLYESGDVKALAQLLQDFIDHPEKIESLSIQAREHILKNHSLAAMVDNYETAYIDTLSANKPIIYKDQTT